MALIGIDRSLAAWRILYERVQQGQEEIREVMLLLERLRRKMETVFPGARAFVRPGFDEDLS